MENCHVWQFSVSNMTLSCAEHWSATAVKNERYIWHAQWNAEVEISILTNSLVWLGQLSGWLHTYFAILFWLHYFWFWTEVRIIIERDVSLLNKAIKMSTQFLHLLLRCNDISAWFCELCSCIYLLDGCNMSTRLFNIFTKIRFILFWTGILLYTESNYIFRLCSLCKLVLMKLT